MYAKSFYVRSTAAGIALGIIISGGMFLYKLVDSPSVAGAAMVDPSKADKIAAPHPRFLQGIEVQFNYPEQFDLLSHIAPNTNATEQYNLGNSSKPLQGVAIGVHRLESGKLEDDPNYRIRILDKAKYSSNNEQLQNESVAVLTKLDRTEKTLFWSHKGKLLIIAISTNNPNDDLPAMLNLIKPTIRWRS